MTILQLENGSVINSGRYLIEDASFEVHAGQMVGLLGPNGAGKTTAVRALLGLQKLASGRASVVGDDIASLSPQDRALKIAYLPQVRQLAWPIIVREAVALGRFAYGVGLGPLKGEDKIAVEQAIEGCDLHALSDRSVASLSGGELGRVHIARAFASSAPALIADEPISALDPRHAFAVLELLQAKARQGNAILVILHDLALAARFCDTIILMDQGKVIASGTPRQALSCENIARVYGMEASWSDSGLLVSGRVRLPTIGCY